MAQPTEFEPLTVVIGISGPSASGKTTLTRLLKELFQDLNRHEDSGKAENDASGDRGEEREGHGRMRVSVLHQDDFYVDDDK